MENFNSINLFIIIPLYNEGTVIQEVINSVSQHFNNIVCINDGSTDNTKEEVLKTRAILIEHAFNLGQGAAIQTGIDYALSNNAQYIATFDGDRQHQVEDLVNMANEMKQSSYDIILGTRFPKSTSIPLFKKLFLKIAVFLNKTFLGLNITDIHNGLRIFTSKAARKIKLENYGMAHASEILDIIRRENFSYSEYPITVRYTKYSKTKGQRLLNAVNIVSQYIINRIK